MEALYTSSFLPKIPYPNYSGLPFIINGRNCQTLKKITAETSLTNFTPIKKLINNYVENLIFKKPPQSSSEKLPIELKGKRIKQVDIFLSDVFKSLDEYISKFLDLPLVQYIDPEHVLSGNFAPVSELPPTACESVEGSLPPCLDGVYIRNGPNPQFVPYGPYHVADGDGMLQAIKISGGRATFCSRYIKTYKYETEGKFRFPFVPSIFSSLNGIMASFARCGLTVARVLTGHFDPVPNGFGVANTSLALFQGRVFALWEGDLPYEIKITRDGDIITVGRHKDFSKSYIRNPFPCTFTAHPKIDQETGEIFAFSYNLISPFLIFFRIDPNRGINEKKEVPIFSMKRASFIHDFSVTKNFAIFPDLQILLDLMEIIKGRTPLLVDPAKIPRLGVIPRYANDESEMWWVDVPGFNLLHAVNAWEEDDGDTIVILASNVLNVEHVAEHMNFLHLSLERITINMKSKNVQRRSLSQENLDFGVINPDYAGKKNKYIYAGVVEAMPRTVGIMKIDVSSSKADWTVAKRMFGSGCYGGEPIFVPKDHQYSTATEEDDGYLVMYVHDENKGESKFIVMDAKSPNLEIVASVKLPQRVPYGFHGIFVSQHELDMLQ